MRYLERMILARRALGRAPIRLRLSFLRSFRQKCPLKVGVVRSAIAMRLDASGFSSSLRMLCLVLWSDRGRRSSINRVLLSGSHPPGEWMLSLREYWSGSCSGRAGRFLDEGVASQLEIGWAGASLENRLLFSSLPSS